VVTLVEYLGCGRVSPVSGLPPKVIMVAVRSYPRYGLPYRDVEELLAEREFGAGSVQCAGLREAIGSCLPDSVTMLE
jgi:hypothetical protein